MNAENLLRKARVEVASETFYLISLRQEDWLKLLENPELSPRMTSPFMIFRDKFETTLLLDEMDFQNVSGALTNAKVESNFRLLTFDIELDFKVVGFLAKISQILAEKDIPVFALSSFSRDHLLIKQDHFAKALVTLSRYVDEIC